MARRYHSGAQQADAPPAGERIVPREIVFPLRRGIQVPTARGPPRPRKGTCMPTTERTPAAAKKPGKNDAARAAKDGKRRQPASDRWPMSAEEQLSMLRDALRAARDGDLTVRLPAD